MTLSYILPKREYLNICTFVKDLATTQNQD